VVAGRRPSSMRGEPQDDPPPAGDTAAPSVRRLHLVGADTYRDWEAVYRDNVERVYRLMFSKVGNRPDAEDLTTEVFLTALGPLRVSASVGEVRAYLLATARTVLAAHWRRTLGRQISVLDDDRIEDLLAQAPSNEEATGRAHRILAALPERYRRILELRFLQACSIKEAAAEMGVSVANAKVLQYRALRLAAAADERLAP
jgi:RNA polymerase sigma-70 factor, ECF subfamily